MLHRIFYRRLLLAFVSLLIFCVTLQAQTLASDSALRSANLPYAVTLYKQGLNNYAGLYNGIEYIGSYPGASGTPCFEWDSLQPGAVQYNGVYYPDIGLKYDLVSNEVVLMGKQNLQVSLLPDKIDFFAIGDHVFVNVRSDSGAMQSLAGFYEVLHNGAMPVLARRTKKVERGSRVEDPFVFKQYNQYYIKKGTAYYAIAGENDVLRLFGDQKDGLKKYLREQNARFKNDKEKYIVSAAAYYEQQNP